MVTQAGSALTGKQRKFLALLRDAPVSVIVAGHRDRFARFGAGYVGRLLPRRDAGLWPWAHPGVDDDLVRDVTEILTSLCARRSGRRAAAGRAARAAAAIIGEVW